MTHKNIEIEIQVNIEESGPFLDFLEKNAVFQSEKRQTDEYFSPAHRDFLSPRPIEEWFRLREAEGECSLTYKKWHYDASGKSHYCDEFETKLDDSGSARKIFAALDFRPLVVVEKTRKIWNYKDYEIAVDAVKGLGDFVEIEYVGRDEVDPAEITEEMVGFLKRFGVGKITRNYVGYPFLMLFPKEAKYKTQ
jgi:adenylate cyclase class 2